MGIDQGQLDSLLAVAVGDLSAGYGGTYYLLACADDAQAVAETSERNNCRPADTRVTIVVIN